MRERVWGSPDVGKAPACVRTQGTLPGSIWTRGTWRGVATQVRTHRTQRRQIRRRVRFCRCTQNINKTRYIRLLRRYLFPVIDQMISFGMQLEDILFQQDNAPVYKAYNVMDWLERHSIEVVDHPPYSPDLNPIEHV